MYESFAKNHKCKKLKIVKRAIRPDKNNRKKSFKLLLKVLMRLKKKQNNLLNT